MGEGKRKLRVAVTGGSGFLGTHLCTLLMKLYDEDYVTLKKPIDFEVSELVVVDLREPNFSHLKFSMIDYDNFAERMKKTIVFKQGSIIDPGFTTAALKDVDVVFHTASLVDYGRNDQKLIYDVNVTGTENVIAACMANEIPYLIYTSSSEAMSWKYKPNVNLKESDEQPVNFDDFLGGHYGFSKREAEKLVLACDQSKLKTVSLRPKGLYGEGDPYFLSNILLHLRSGNLKAMIGTPETEFESIYIGNVAFSHVFALDTLLKKEDSIKGQAFFVSCEPHSSMAKFGSYYSDIVNKKMPERYIPAHIIIPIAKFCDIVRKFLPASVRKATAEFTEMTIRSTAVTQTLDGSKLRSLGYYDVFSQKVRQFRTRYWLMNDWLRNIEERELKEKQDRLYRVLAASGVLVVLFIAYSLA